MKYFLVACAVAVSACSPVPVKDLREEAPYKSATFNAEYSELWSCVLEKLIESPPSSWSQSTGNLQYESYFRKKQGMMLVTGSMVSHFKIPIIDLTFIDKSGQTLAEIRAGGIIDGPRYASKSLADAAWIFVEECSK